MRAAGVEPILVKGWAIARRYPDPALRPYGDIDLCVHPEQVQQARAALKCFEHLDSHYVDLHAGVDSVGRGGNVEPRVLEARALARARFITGRQSSKQALPHGGAPDRWDEVFVRSRLVPLGGDQQVRILSDEDHLRVLCLHLLRSGAWRPLWLVDVAVALETRREDFDWDTSLSRDPKDANWVECTIALAQELLGADLADQRSESRGQRSAMFRNSQFAIRISQSAFRSLPSCRLPRTALPAWLKPAVLRQWGRCQNPSTVKGTLPTLLRLRRNPREFLREIYARWDHPIRSTAALERQFNNWPRAPYQLVDTLLRMRTELPKQLRGITQAARPSGSQFAIRDPQFD